MSPTARLLIRKLDSIARLDEEDRQSVAELPMSLRDAADNEDIVREGDRPTRCCLVVDGFTHWYKTIPDGRRQIVAFNVPGDLPDLHSLHIAVMDCSLSASTPCRLAFVNHEDVKALCRRRPQVAGALWRSTLIDGATFREWMLGTGRRSALENTAHLLCELLLRLDAMGMAAGNNFSLPFTQTEIGDALGLTPVSVNRALGDLKASGLIAVSRRSVTVLDWAGLKRLCQFDPTYLHLQPNAAEAPRPAG